MQRHLVQTTLLKSIPQNPKEISWTAGSPVRALEVPERYMQVESIHQTLLRQACYERNIFVDTWIDHKGVPRWSARGEDRVIQFKQNMPATTSQAVRERVSNKAATKVWLESLGFRVPKGITLENTQVSEAKQWYRESGAEMVVVKPRNGSGGQGVFSAIKSEQGIDEAFSENKRRRPNSLILVEEHITGEDYRILLVAGKVIGAIHRIPAHVTGDGISTVRELVDAKNLIRRANPYVKKSVIQLGDAEEKKLSAAGLTTDSVLKAGDVFTFHAVANVGRGGDSYDVTDEMHPGFVSMLEEKAAKFRDMQYCGLDLIAEDVTRSPTGQQHAVIELNVNCDLALHHFPLFGKARDAAGAVIQSLFPNQPKPNKQRLEIHLVGKGISDRFLAWIVDVGTQCQVDGTASINSAEELDAVVTGTQAGVDAFLRQVMIGPKGTLPGIAELKFAQCP